MEYGEKITELRKSRGMTQAELGKELNVTYQAVSNWERGEAVPDFATLSKISKIFNVPITYFESGSTEIPAAVPAIKPEMLGVCTVCGKVIYKGNEGQTSPTLVCTDCVKRRDRAQEAERQNAIQRARQIDFEEVRAAKKRRNTGFLVGGLVAGVLLILAIVGVFLEPTETVWQDFGEVVAGGLIIFTFITQLFWGGIVVKIIKFGAKAFVSIFSWGGLVVIILLSLIIFPILIGFFILCLLAALVISPFSFIPATIRVCVACRSK